MLETIHKALTAHVSITFQSVIFCTDQSDISGREKPGMPVSPFEPPPFLRSEADTFGWDLINLRVEEEVIRSLEAQKCHSDIWKRLDSRANVIVLHTIKQAVELIRKDYSGATILVMGSHYLVGGTLHILQSENPNWLAGLDGISAYASKPIAEWSSTR